MRRHIVVSLAEGRLVRDLLGHGFLDLILKAGYQITLVTPADRVPSFVGEWQRPGLHFVHLDRYDDSRAPLSRAMRTRKRLAQLAAERVIRMGEDPTAVFVTGCPSIDLAAQVLRDPTLDFDPFVKYGGVGSKLSLSSGYLVVMQHPVTTECDAARDQVVETLHAVRDLDMPTLWFWPNVDAGSDGTSRGIRSFREIEKPANIHFFKNMMPEDFLKVIYNSRCIVGNSSVGIRESSFLGVPAVNIGDRQAGRERGSNTRDATHERRKIADAIQHHLGNGKLKRDSVYGDGRAGQRIADLLGNAKLRIEKMLTY